VEGGREDGIMSGSVVKSFFFTTVLLKVLKRCRCSETRRMTSEMGSWFVPVWSLFDPGSVVLLLVAGRPSQLLFVMRHPGTEEG